MTPNTDRKKVIKKENEKAPSFSHLLAQCLQLRSARAALRARQTRIVRESTRFEGGGWIVFIGTGEDRVPENARAKVRAFAAQNIANECSFIPVGVVTDAKGYKEGNFGIVHQLLVAELRLA